MFGRMISPGRNDDYDRGLRYFDQGLYEAAIPELDLATESDNKVLVRLANFYLAECWSYLASYAMGQRLFDRAAECFEAALKRNPGYADLHCKLSAVYYLKDRIEEADRELGIALSINPRYARALVQAGLCKYRLGSPGLGIQMIQQAVELDPILAGESYKRGCEAHMDGDFSEAANHFSLVIVADIDEVAYHARLGADYFRRGLLEAASTEFENAVQINPNYADLHNSLGMTYHSAGKYLLAVSEFKKALAINPLYEDAKCNLQLSSEAAEEAGETIVNLEMVDDGHQDRHETAS
jgi:tetratricopeptide (TPR) repeat protein